MYIGKSMHIIGNCMIVKCKNIKPEYLGRTVFDEKKRKVGKIIDIFGNVNSPYAKILIGKNKNIILKKDIFLR
ncbi:MAG TPA: RNA-binding protein [Methanomicrobia archaeon]|nr:MAG: RNA-binding protein [Thermococci archaeon]HDN81217.1 RNA-binding protein [Methanomicrobia archaeon]